MKDFRFDLHEEVCYTDGASIVFGRVIAREDIVEGVHHYCVMTQYGVRIKPENELHESYDEVEMMMVVDECRERMRML